MLSRYRRMSRTGGKSLAELARHVERPSFEKMGVGPVMDERTSKTGSRSTWRDNKSPRSPMTSVAGEVRGEKTPRTPVRLHASSDRMKIRVHKDDAQTTVTINSGLSPTSATPTTAAPEQDETILKPSLSRAEALGARPGHFARTHASKLAPNVPTHIEIVLPKDVVDDHGDGVCDDSPKSCESLRRRRALRPPNGNRRSPKSRDKAGFVVASHTSEREKQLEERLAALEAQLSAVTSAKGAPALVLDDVQEDHDPFANAAIPALVSA